MTGTNTEQAGGKDKSNQGSQVAAQTDSSRAILPKVRDINNENTREQQEILNK